MNLDLIINNYPQRILRNAKGQWVLGDTPDLWLYNDELTEYQQYLIVEHNEKYPIQVSTK